MDVNETEIPSYNEALGMLAARAREGSVTAIVALERALRNVREEEESEDPVNDAIQRILAEKRSDRT
jgi:predicted component of type VI protein secretion system